MRPTYLVGESGWNQGLTHLERESGWNQRPSQEMKQALMEAYAVFDGVSMERPSGMPRTVFSVATAGGDIAM